MNQPSREKQESRSDLAAGVTRREALVLLGAAGAATLAGCPMSTDADGTGGTVIGGCVVTPEATEGPYFVDELLNRSDIRADPASGVSQSGLPLRLRIRVSSIVGGVCSAVAGATVDVWHCNAQGIYSDVAANGTVGQKWLRGHQLTDENGAVEFTTIYPGWYMGRTVHIHFKVRSGSLEFTSQLYFEETITAQAYGESPYAARGLPNTSNAEDGIFDADTLLTLTPDGTGYLGAFDVAMNLS